MRLAPQKIIPTAEFFATLGHYVYFYVDGPIENFDPIKDCGRVVYVGVGVGKRGMAHVKAKDYDPANCYIAMSNIYSKKSAHEVETLLITMWDTVNNGDNKVNGHHKEKYIMASLFGMFGNHNREQFNGIDMQCTICEKYPLVREMGAVEGTPSVFTLTTPRHDGHQVKFLWRSSGAELLLIRENPGLSKKGLSTEEIVAEQETSLHDMTERFEKEFAEDLASGKITSGEISIATSSNRAVSKSYSFAEGEEEYGVEVILSWITPDDIEKNEINAEKGLTIAA